MTNDSGRLAEIEARWSGDDDAIQAKAYELGLATIRDIRWLVGALRAANERAAALAEAGLATQERYEAALADYAVVYAEIERYRKIALKED